MRLTFVLALAGTACGVSLDSPEGGAALTIDAGGGAARDAGAASDAAPDARPCVGGDARMAAPDGRCVVLLAPQVTYVQATAACTALGGGLLIADNAEIDAIARALTGTRNAYIGLTDLATEGTFAWADATPVAYTNWYAGEPNDGNAAYPEDCAVITAVRAGLWDDRPCAPVSGVGGGNYSTLCQI